MRRGLLLAVTGLLVAGCSGSSSSPTAAPTSTAAVDRTFLARVAHDDKLAAKDDVTLTGLGREACDLLDDYHGNTAKVDAFFVKTAGEGGRRFFDPATMTTLRRAAAAAYCPKWRAF